MRFRVYLSSYTVYDTYLLRVRKYVRRARLESFWRQESDILPVCQGNEPCGRTKADTTMQLVNEDNKEEKEEGGWQVSDPNWHGTP